jgi:membrane fusion protein
MLAATLEYARKETVRGWLVAQQGVVRLTHDTPAHVASVMVAPGQMVHRGDVIAYLSEDGILEDGSAAAGAIIEILREEIGEIRKREVAAREQFDSDREAFAAQLRGLDDELRALATQEREQDARVARSSSTLERLERAWHSGAVAEIELLGRQDEHAALRQSKARLRQEQERLHRERRGLVAKQRKAGTDLELRLSELASLRNELRQRITRNESARLQAVESPIHGTVATLDLVAGSTIHAQQLLATIVPSDADLVADIYVPSRAVGLIEPGQLVRLRFDAFPQQQFGTANGHVHSIAEYVLLPADVPATFGLREASYKVRIGLERDHVTDAYGSYRLRPGMLLVAEIVLENRRLVDWLRARFELPL